MTVVTFNTCLLLAVLGVLTFSCWRKYRHSASICLFINNSGREDQGKANVGFTGRIVFSLCFGSGFEYSGNKAEI